MLMRGYISTGYLQEYIGKAAPHMLYFTPHAIYLTTPHF